jgi:hypothetical protein
MLVPLKLTPSAPEPDMILVLMRHLDVELPIFIPFDVDVSIAQV